MAASPAEIPYHHHLVDTPFSDTTSDPQQQPYNTPAPKPPFTSCVRLDKYCTTTDYSYNDIALKRLGKYSPQPANYYGFMGKRSEDTAPVYPPNTDLGIYSSGPIPVSAGQALRVVLSVTPYMPISGDLDPILYRSGPQQFDTVKGRVVSCFYPKKGGDQWTYNPAGFPSILKGIECVGRFENFIDDITRKTSVFTYPVCGDTAVVEFGLDVTSLSNFFPTTQVGAGAFYRLSMQYFLLYSSGTASDMLLQHSGFGASLFEPYANTLKGLISSDGTVGFTETSTTIDLRAPYSVAGDGISIDHTAPLNPIITNTAPDQTVTLTEGANITVTGTYPNFTIAAATDGVGGQVDSVVAGSSISIDNTDPVNPIITNTAPDQIVSLASGTGISATGTYPNFTVTNTAPDQTVSLASGTGISATGTYPNFTVTNTAPDQTVTLAAGTGISVTGVYPSFTVTNTMVDMMTMPLGELSYADAAVGWLLNVTATFPGSDNIVAPPTTLVSTSNNAASPYFDSPSNGALRYLGMTTQRMHCAISISGKVAAANKVWNLDVHKNGSPIPKSVFRFENPTGSGSTAGLITVAFHVEITFATNDYIECYIGNVTDTTDMTIHNLNIVCMGTVSEYIHVVPL
jgi:hypothetical protein